MSSVKTLFCDKCGKILISEPSIKCYAIKKKYVSLVSGYVDDGKIEFDFCNACFKDVYKYFTTPNQEKRWDKG